MANTTRDEAREKVGRALKEMREAANLTQRDVSSHLGYTTAQFVSNWERGVSSPPDEALPRLANLFAVQPRRLLSVMLRYQEDVWATQMEAVVSVFRESTRGRRAGYKAG